MLSNGPLMFPQWWTMWPRAVPWPAAWGMGRGPSLYPPRPADGRRQEEWLSLPFGRNCSFSLGDWPSALRYALEGVKISRDEMGSGFVRSLCQEADGYLYLGDPVRAWDLYTAAAKASPGHPLPRYYRGQGSLLLAKLLDLYQRDSVEDG